MRLVRRRAVARLPGAWEVAPLVRCRDRAPRPWVWTTAHARLWPPTEPGRPRVQLAKSRSLSARRVGRLAASGPQWLLVS